MRVPRITRSRDAGVPFSCESGDESASTGGGGTSAIADVLAEDDPAPDPWWQAGIDESLEE